jgi:hypothetical protein
MSSMVWPRGIEQATSCIQLSCHVVGVQTICYCGLFQLPWSWVGRGAYQINLQVVKQNCAAQSTTQTRIERASPAYEGIHIIFGIG